MIASIALGLAIALAPARPTSSAVEEADDAWAAGHFADAAEAYARAYVETGDIAYLFARGEAQREAGDCQGATATFEAFIATEPLEQAVEAAKSSIEACRDQLPAPSVDAPAPVESPTPAVADGRAGPSPIESAPRWRRDPAAISLLAVGGAVGVAGVTLAIVARTEQREADRARDLVGFGEHNERAVAFSRASIPLLVVGGALLVGGAVRYAILARRARGGVARARVGLLRF